MCAEPPGNHQHHAEATTKNANQNLNDVGLTGRETFIGLILDRMNQIRKVGPIVDEKRGYMITNQVMITTCAVYLSGEAVSVSTDFTSSGAGDNHGEASKNVARNAFTEPTGRGYVAPVAIWFKSAIGSMTKSVYDAFRLPLAIKMEQLLSCCRIFQEHIASRAST